MNRLSPLLRGRSWNEVIREGHRIGVHHHWERGGEAACQDHRAKLSIAVRSSIGSAGVALEPTPVDVRDCKRGELGRLGRSEGIRVKAGEQRLSQSPPAPRKMSATLVTLAYR